MMVVSDDGGVPELAPEDETLAVSASRKSQEIVPPVLQQRTVVKVLTGLEAGRVHVVTTEEVIVGRASTCALRIDDSSLSRQHCRIRRTGGSYFVEDLGSRNGTQVNGLRIKAPMLLEDGALIQLAAGTIIMFSHQEDLDRKSTRLNSSHTEIYTLSLHDALPISRSASTTRRSRASTAASAGRAAATSSRTSAAATARRSTACASRRPCSSRTAPSSSWRPARSSCSRTRKT